MYAADEVTVERAQKVLAALEYERTGYEARIAATEKGLRPAFGLPLTVEQLDDRIKQVDAEIARVKKDVVSAESVDA
jgi:hypothetical protein